jgi:hypothetical protein
VDADGTIKIEYRLPGSQVPDNADYRVYRFVPPRIPDGGGCPDSGSMVDPTGGSWNVADGRLGIPDALVGIDPAADFGNYRIYRLP